MAHIIFLLTQSLDSPSGIGRYFPLAKQLVCQDHKVTIFALHPDYDALVEKTYRTDGVVVRYVAQMHVRKSENLKSYYSPSKLFQITLKATWKLSKAALSSKADILLIGKPHPMNSIAGLIARSFHSCKLILDCDDYETESGRFASTWQKSIIAWFEKWMPKRVDSILTNTFFMQDKLIQWGVNPGKIHYLSNGTDPSRFQKTEAVDLQSLRSELDIQGKKVIGYIGSLSLPSHPVDILLEAVSILHAKHPDLCLLLIGGGEDLPMLQEQAVQLKLSNVVRFVGRVSPEYVWRYYSLLDVSVDPVYDNQAAKGRSPLKLFESWFCGIPFVTSDVGDRRVLFGEPPAGILAEPGDPGSLAVSIQRVLTEPHLAEELRNRGLERVKLYTWEHLVKGIASEFQIQPGAAQDA